MKTPLPPSNPLFINGASAPLIPDTMTTYRIYINAAVADAEKALDLAGVTGAARRTIISFERNIASCQYKLLAEWDFQDVLESSAGTSASKQLDKLSGNGHRSKGRYWAEWVAYCQQIDCAPDTTLPDHLC